LEGKAGKEPGKCPNSQQYNGKVESRISLSGTSGEVAALEKMVSPYQNDGDYKIAREKNGHDCQGNSVRCTVYRDGYRRSIRCILDFVAAASGDSERPVQRAITVNDGVRIASVETGRPLLFGLMSDGIYIPSACGGRGVCGQCRVCIKTKRLPHTEAERSLISESDREFGIHLSCQVRVSLDLSIEIPWKHFAASQYSTRVAGLRSLTSEIREVTLDVTGPRELSFVAGQYIQLFLPGTESTPEPLYRAYSIASSPSYPRRLVVMVRRESGGTVSPYICDHLREGQELVVRGPFGDFRMHDSLREALLIAGGSGLAPLWAMLQVMAEEVRAGKISRKTTLYFSARKKNDLFLVNELLAMEKILPFRFVPALSNPRPAEPWDGERGGISAVLDRRLDRLDNHEAYLCGSAGMIDACIRVLQAKGLSEEFIFFDKFL